MRPVPVTYSQTYVELYHKLVSRAEARARVARPYLDDPELRHLATYTHDAFLEDSDDLDALYELGTDYQDELRRAYKQAYQSEMVA